jgi:hypothetical protein
LNWIKAVWKKQFRIVHRSAKSANVGDSLELSRSNAVSDFDPGHGFVQIREFETHPLPPALTRALEDTYRGVRQAAAEALRKIGGAK